MRTRNKILLAVGIGALVVALLLASWLWLRWQMRIWQRAQSPDVVETPPSRVVVVAALPGAGPDVIEAVLVAPIERALAEIPGVTRVDAVTSSGRCAVTVSLRPDVDLWQARAAVLAKLQALDALPDEAERPVILAPAARAAALVLCSNCSSRDLQTLRFRLTALPRVERVTLYGDTARRIVIAIDPPKAAAAELDLPMIVTAVRSLVVGDRATDDAVTHSAFLLRAKPAALDIAHLRELVLSAPTNSAPISLRSIATIALERATDCGAFSDGKPTAALLVRGDVEPVTLRRALRNAPQQAVLRLAGEEHRYQIWGRGAPLSERTALTLPPGTVLLQCPQRRGEPLRPMIWSATALDRWAATYARTIGGRLVPISAPLFELLLFGDEANVRTQAREQIVRALLEHLREKIAIEDTAGQVPRMDIALDRRRAAAFGITAKHIAETVAFAQGKRLLTASDGTEVVLRWGEGTAEDLARVTLRTPAGTNVPLRSVATIKIASSAEHIRHCRLRRCDRLLIYLDDANAEQTLRQLITAALFRTPLRWTLAHTRRLP
ncbi:MAG: efflux RND transporter permease subunit [Deltaproteobacteria bacterium]|nr:efflux RND transporter permease subunit [Deltaproteobacteria bacterium]